MSDEEGACWLHDDEAIVKRSEIAVKEIEHCSICGNDVRWQFIEQPDDETIARVMGRVGRLDKEEPNGL